MLLWSLLSAVIFEANCNCTTTLASVLLLSSNPGDEGSYKDRKTTTPIQEVKEERKLDDACRAETKYHRTLLRGVRLCFRRRGNRGGARLWRTEDTYDLFKPVKMFSKLFGKPKEQTNAVATLDKLNEVLMDSPPPLFVV
ncbi:hypothetical protein BHM03_00017528 [Ensete ventricosum]|nr:hypothetical protein BHM03_00017528 [Ensete ventricosum]